MSSSKFASTFAPYTPPPDDPSNASRAGSSQSASRVTRPWFPTHESYQHPIASYQSGGLPSLNNSMSGSTGPTEETHLAQHQWDTRFGTRVDIMAAFAYLLGPISALVLLILETHNDYVRFHAYQSALLTTPILLLRIFGTLVHFWSFLVTILTILLFIVQFFMAFQAYRDASMNNLSRFYLPYIGPLADRWVEDE
ncbi:hypothetical protein BD410DRAFT_222744 [Rickenella mellea]|uniref:Uncharacterized protein n=1 Tax=Rickenella mellea TaxID=50990 RepID=A0A4Y7QNJ5_9AGAM|nr:hypothetical protein BD410DRAFT_222744 [Rickenella mellea]